MKLILISAKLQNGKDTTAELLKEELENKGKRVLIAHYADLLKYICKTFFNWDGIKDEKGRSILQYVGTDVIRHQCVDYWVKFMMEFLFMFRKEWDYVLIPDTRFQNEIEYASSSWIGEENIFTVRINRPNFNSGATQEQLNHPSECALDEYRFDYYIENDSTLDDLKLKVKDLLDDINNTVV